MLNKLQLPPIQLYNAELFSAAKVMSFSELTNTRRTCSLVDSQVADFQIVDKIFDSNDKLFLMSDLWMSDFTPDEVYDFAGQPNS